MAKGLWRKSWLPEGLFSTVLGTILLAVTQASADPVAAAKWVDNEFKPSTLSRDQQIAEMDWFIKASAPYKGMEVHIISETLTTHKYEAEVLAKAFEEITGIKVVHHVKTEGDVVDRIKMEMQSQRMIYDAYINDSDFIGTHFRYGDVLPLSDFMAGEGKDVTLPTLDVDDFMGKSFTTGPDGKLYQLPDQQFPNLYWFRYDLFQRADLREKFKSKYGYELDVPVNWSAYEDIAEFFTNDVKEIDGKPIYGHMDYGKRDPSLQWRMTDAWFSMAGSGDVGLPNGQPVDEWGIRVEGCHPAGATVARGGDVNGPAAVYAITKYVDWMNKYAPPGAKDMDFGQAGPLPAQGNVAQQIFWYAAFTADMIKTGLPVVNEDGTPKWRMAPSPYGAYWQEGQKLGYQDAGAWTFFRWTQPERRNAAWLYAQFVVSKTVSLKKTIVGLTPIRNSDMNSQAMTDMAPRLGGLVEFYRSPAKVAWTPTGTNVPDYAKLSDLWWQNIGMASSGQISPQQALDQLGDQIEKVLGRVERQGQKTCAPKLNPKVDPQEWLDKPGAPQPKLANEKPQGKTVPYEQLLQAWREGRQR